MNIQTKGECEMNKKIKTLRKEIWKLMRVKIPTIFESSVDEEEELEADLEVELSIGKYAGQPHGNWGMMMNRYLLQFTRQVL